MRQHPLYRPPTPTRQTLAVTLYVLYFTVRKGSSATVCLHFVAYCCFLFSKETSPYEKKQAITILASIETYENLVSFQNVKELNDTVRAYKEQFADRLNKNQLAVLNHLHTHSCKYFGVSFKSKRRLLKYFILAAEQLFAHADT